MQCSGSLSGLRIMVISAQREDVTREFLRVQRIAYHYTPFRFKMDNSKAIPIF